jgi:hypothetical protein
VRDGVVTLPLWTFLILGGDDEGTCWMTKELDWIFDDIWIRSLRLALMIDLASVGLPKLSGQLRVKFGQKINIVFLFAVYANSPLSSVSLVS